MKYRIAHYKSMKGKKQEKILTFKFEENEEIDVSCYDKQYFDKKKHKDDIVGYIRLKNKEYTGKEYATLYGIEDKAIDIRSKKKIYERTIGYLFTEDEEYLAVVEPCFLIILFGFLIAGLLICLFFVTAPYGNNEDNDPDPSIITPSGEVEEDPADENQDADIVARLILPDGVISFDGETKKKDGKGKIKVILKVDGEEHTLISDREITIEDGKITDLPIDFEELDFEIKPGIYDGEILIVYPDGSSDELIIECFVVSATSGSIDISYSDKVRINLQSGVISLQYMPSNAPKESVVQIILISNDKEYILAESVAISNNQKLVSLQLAESMKTKLAQGTYSGVIRVFMDPNNADAAASIHTDIEVTISVYQ